MLSTVGLPSVIHAAAPDRGKLVTLVAGKGSRLLSTGDDDAEFNAEQNLIVRSFKF